MSHREPVSRPLDVIAAEVILSLSQALLAGVLVWLAADFWADRGVPGSMLLILAALGLTVGGAWLVWLLGGPGWPMAAANLPVVLLMAFVLLVGLQGVAPGDIGAFVPLVGLAAAIYGIACGFFLVGPRRLHWRGARKQRTRAGAVAPPTPRISPTLSRTIQSLPRVQSIRLPSAASIKLRRPTSLKLPSAASIKLRRPTSIGLPRRKPGPPVTRTVLTAAPPVRPTAPAPTRLVTPSGSSRVVLPGEAARPETAGPAEEPADQGASTSRTHAWPVAPPAEADAPTTRTPTLGLSVPPDEPSSRDEDTRPWPRPPRTR